MPASCFRKETEHPGRTNFQLPTQNRPLSSQCNLLLAWRSGGGLGCLVMSSMYIWYPKCLSRSLKNNKSQHWQILIIVQISVHKYLPESTILYPFYRWGNWGLENCSTNWAGRGRGNIWIGAIWIKSVSSLTVFLPTWTFFSLLPKIGEHYNAWWLGSLSNRTQLGTWN